jgi:pimeloyl-ACP methyl ester carboxylesterase
MASRNPNRAPKPSQPRQPDFSRYPPRPASDPNTPPEVVHPLWLAKALGLTILAAILCAYAAVCLLVYQGGWQLMLHPAHTISGAPATAFTPIRFDAAETGTPRLVGWWIPAELPTPGIPTILYLHDGDGDLSGNTRLLDLLHTADVNIFAFDYRGYGQSAGPHPTESRMAEDSAAALDYLTNTRHLPAATIVPYGEGLGAVLAAQLAKAHPELPAFIVDSPKPDAFRDATGAVRARLLPMRLLVQEHFDLAGALKSSTKPKLLLADGPFGSESGRRHANEVFFRTVPGPKMTVTFARPDANAEYIQSINRFLDEYLPRQSLRSHSQTRYSVSRQ